MYLPSDNPTSLIAWFRRGVGVTITGSGVSSWADQSGNGNDLLQGTDTNRPAYDGSAVITFDGVDNFLKCNTFTLAQPTQISILVNQVTWTGNEYIFDGNTTTSGALRQVGVSPALVLHVSGTQIGSNSGATVGAFHAITSVFNGASSSIQVDGNAATTGTLPGTPDMSGFTLAWHGDSSPVSQFGNIAVKEIIIRNVNDATIRANDHQYLIDLDTDVTPVADFSATPLTGEPTLSVTFTDLSTNSPREWLWDFGDSQTSTSQNPTHNYMADGTYTVTLTATNYAGSDQEVKTGYITVTTPVVVTTDSPRGTFPWLAPYKGHEVRKRTPEDVRKMREKFGVIPARVIEEVAQRQVERLEVDQQKQFEELHRELTIAEVKWEAKYLEALTSIREYLLNAEIEQRLKTKVNNDRLRALVLMAAAV